MAGLYPITALALLLSAPAAQAATSARAPAGTLSDGRAIEAITLSNAHGVSARILTYGATLQSFSGPDRKGHVADVVLGFDTAREYERAHSYFGATVGRYANRIAHGRFTLDGTAFQLPHNDDDNSLHGGGEGFDRQVWTVRSITSGRLATAVLSYTSPDGALGYPGEVTVTVTYSLDEAGNLGIDFAATTTKPTVLNITNHALFNMAGEGAAEGAMRERLTVPASRYTPVTPALIPTGELRPVAGSPFDFRNGRVLAVSLRDGKDEQIVRGRGYDHNFVLDKGATATPQLAARLIDPASGRTLEVLSTEPGLQLYTGNFINATTLGKKGHLYRMGDGIALEPQKFPDTPNQPAFGSARVDPDHPYHHHMIYRLTVAPLR